MADDNSGGDLHDLTDLDGVGSGKAESLREAGFESVADVRDASSDELTRADGIGDALAAEIDESAAELGDADGEEATVQADGGEATAETEEEEEADEDEGDAEEDDSDADDSDAESDDDDAGSDDDSKPEVDADDLDMLEVRDAVKDVAETLIEDPFDGIIEIERDEEGWYAVVEVIERSAVPDTQDILGRYAIDLDNSGSVLGYRLTDRYRRGDTSNDE